MVAIHGRNGMGNDAHTLSLLHLNGADDATTFTDSGRLGATWAATANAVTSVDDSKFGGSSLRIPDGTSYISGSTPTDEQVTNGSFETGDFTGWTKTGTYQFCIIEAYGHGGGNNLTIDSLGDTYSGGVYQSIDVTNVDNLTFWYFSLDGGHGDYAHLNVYLDTDLIGTYDLNGTGEVAEYALATIDISAYTGTKALKFIVDSTLNVAEGVAFIDQISALAGGAADWLLTGDFTIDGWIKSDTATEWSLCGQWGASGEYAWLLWGQDTADKVSIYLSDDGTTITEIKGEHNITADAWTHVAAVRRGTTVNVYKNGALIKSGVFSGATHASTSLLTCPNSTKLDEAYINEVRVSDCARWLSEFNPPNRQS